MIPIGDRIESDLEPVPVYACAVVRRAWAPLAGDLAEGEDEPVGPRRLRLGL